MLAGVFLTIFAHFCCADPVFIAKLIFATAYISPFYYSAFPVCRRFQSMELQFAAMKGLMRACLYKVMQAFFAI